MPITYTIRCARHAVQNLKSALDTEEYTHTKIINYLIDDFTIVFHCC